MEFYALDPAVLTEQLRGAADPRYSANQSGQSNWMKRLSILNS